MQININGPWHLYWGASSLPENAEAIGVIERSAGDRGALIRLANGHYVQGNAGIIRSLDQTAVKKLLGLPTRGGYRPGSGRPATGVKPNRTFRLDDEEFRKVKEFIKKMRSEKK